MATKLDWHEIEEVSVVDAGANRKKRFPITKRRNQEMSNYKELFDLALESETPVEGEVDIQKRGENDEEKAALVAVLRFADACGVRERLLETGQKEALAKELTAPAKDATPEAPEKVDNSMNEEIAKRFETLQKQLDTERTAREAVETELQKAQDAAELAQWENKAEKNLQHVPGDLKELAKSLFDISKTNPEAATAQYERLCQTSELVAKSEAFKAIGTRGQNEASFEAKIAKRRQELRGEGLTDLEALRRAALEAEKGQ